MRNAEDALTGWQQRVEQQTSLTMELSRRMEQTRASAEARGGEVFVAVDSSGGMAELELNDDAMRLGPGELALLIMDTNRRAQARLAQQMVEMVGGLYGQGSETAAFISGAYTERFPEQLEDDEEPGRR